MQISAVRLYDRSQAMKVQCYEARCILLAFCMDEAGRCLGLSEHNGCIIAAMLLEYVPLPHVCRVHLSHGQSSVSCQLLHAGAQSELHLASISHEQLVKGRQIKQNDACQP